MKKRLVTIIGTGILVAGLSAAGISFAQTGTGGVQGGTIKVGGLSEADFPAKALISMDEAVQNVLSSAPGQVLKVELEDENGFLVYGVEVVTADKAIMDVKVDAGSGKILGMERDNEDDEDHDSGKDNDLNHED